MSREELLKGLSEEQIAKVNACKSPEELLALARDEGVELTDEQLSAISGGFCSQDDDEEDSNNNKKPPINNPF